LWPRSCHAFFRHLMAVVSSIHRYPFDGKLGEPQIRQGPKSFFTTVENLTTIPRSSSPKPSHHTDRILVALPGRQQKLFFSKVSRQALVHKHPPFQWAPAAFRWKHRTRCMKLKTHLHIASLTKRGVGSRRFLSFMAWCWGRHVIFWFRFQNTSQKCQSSTVSRLGFTTVFTFMAPYQSTLNTDFKCC